MTVEEHADTAGSSGHEGLGLSYQDPVEELLESRLLARDFEVEGGTVRIETRVRIRRSPWSVTSTILENGVEVQEGPFAPVSDELDVDSYDPESFEDLRREFATQVVALHESRCRDVESALTGGEATENAGGSRGGLLALVSVLLIAVAGGFGYYLWQQKSKEGGGADLAATEIPGENGEPLATEGDEEAAGTEAPEASGPSPPTFEREEPPATPATSESRSPAPPARRRTPPPTPSPTPTPRDEPDPAPSGPVGEPENVVPPREATQPGADPSRRLAISDLRPEHYRLGISALGDYVFSDDDAVLVSAPPSHLGLSCIRTSAKDRTREGSVTFIVDRPTRILVAHDSRINKKPTWLQGFTPLGIRWEVDGVSPEEIPVVYEVFSRSFAPGMVRLGPNVEWTAITRRMRRTFEKDLAMYLVCVDGG
jgi:hypothetical protein